MGEQKRRRRRNFLAGLAVLIGAAVVLLGVHFLDNPAPSSSDDGAGEPPAEREAGDADRVTGQPEEGAVAEMRRDVEQSGITWTFDREHAVGRFVNGDWWVVAPEGESSVRVEQVDPAPVRGPDGEEGSRRHGSMADPEPGGSQGYDSRARGYSEEASVEFPYELKVNTSLVSTRSRPEDDVFNPPGTGLYGNERSRGYPSDAAVLTCLPEVPPADAFRPPYSGEEKPILRAGALDLDRLPSLEPVENTPSLSHYERGFERVWLDHVIDWPGQNIRPNNHMPSYGRDMARHLGDAALLLCLDDIGDRTRLAKGLVQTGIDFYGIGAAGGGWPANGGHGHGRKLPIVLAGYLMYDPGGGGEANDLAYEMLHIGRKPRYGEDGAWRFQEDENHFFVSQTDLERRLDVERCRGYALSATEETIGVNHPGRYAPLQGNVLEITDGPGAGQRRRIVESTVPRTGGEGVLTVSEPWEEIPVEGESHYQVRGYEEHHLGMPEWGIVHAAAPQRDNPSWQAEYRGLVGYSSTGFTLAARLIGLKEAWNHDPLFAYMDRYMEETSGRSLSGFAGSMWTRYRGDPAGEKD